MLSPDACSSQALFTPLFTGHIGTLRSSAIWGLVPFHMSFAGQLGTCSSKKPFPVTSEKWIQRHSKIHLTTPTVHNQTPCYNKIQGTSTDPPILHKVFLMNTVGNTGYMHCFQLLPTPLSKLFLTGRIKMLLPEPKEHTHSSFERSRTWGKPKPAPCATSRRGTWIPWVLV